LISHYIVAFSSQVNLHATQTSQFPANVRGFFNLKYGTLLQQRTRGCPPWDMIHAHKASSLLLFYLMLLEDMRLYYYGQPSNACMELDWQSYTRPLYKDIIQACMYPPVAVAAADQLSPIQQVFLSPPKDTNPPYESPMRILEDEIALLEISADE